MTRRHWCPIENVPGWAGIRDRIAACGAMCTAATGTSTFLYVRCRACVALARGLVDRTARGPSKEGG